MNRYKYLGITAMVFISILITNMNSISIAGEYPKSPIKLIVAYPPGGATDFQARIVTMLASLDKYFGQPVLIINKPGAGGQVGWNWSIEKGTRDGYTMFVYNVPHFIAQSVVYQTKYNIRNCEPIANWGADPAVLIVPKDSPFDSVKKLIEYAQKYPKKVTVSGAGMFVGHHIALLQLCKSTGTQMTYIPEKGGVPAMQSVIAGNVKAGFNNLSDSYRNKAHIKILAVADVERHEFLPDVKTFKEMGIDVDDASVNFRGVAFPAGVPDEIVDKSSSVLLRMFNDSKVKAKMKNSGSPTKIMTRAQVINMFQAREAFLVPILNELKEK